MKAYSAFLFLALFAFVSCEIFSGRPLQKQAVREKPDWWQTAIVSDTLSII